MEDISPISTIERSRPKPRSLSHAVRDLDAALAAARGLPASHGGLRSALASLREALDEHVRVSEAPGGFLDEIRRCAPRLSHRAEQVHRDHVTLREYVADCEALVSVEVATPDEMRAAVKAASSMIARHARRTADLAWEAMAVDVEAAD